MKIAGYTSSWNDKAGVWRCIDALLRQTHPLSEIIVVDNRSSDGTPLEPFPKQVTLLCHLSNLGVGGAAATAFEYALANGYEWLWVLDQDSVPRHDALRKLVELYGSLPHEIQRETGIVASLCLSDERKKEVHGALLTARGKRSVKVDPQKRYYECDATIWSGSMFNLSAVRSVGSPRFGSTDWREGFGGMDWADLEFGFRIKQAGYRVLVSRESIVEHSVGTVIRSKWLRGAVVSSHSPERLYVRYRNMVYFYVYIHPNRYLVPVIVSLATTLMIEIVKCLLSDPSPGRKVRACVRGFYRGLRRDLRSPEKA